MLKQIYFKVILEINSQHGQYKGPYVHNPHAPKIFNRFILNLVPGTCSKILMGDVI